MIRYYWLLFLLFCSFASEAQYTDIINSSRPGFSETPFAVGSGIIQMEGGFTYSTADNFSKNSVLKSNLFNQTLRFGAASERLEFKLLFNQDFNKTKSKISSDYGGSLGGSVGLGIKFLVFDPRKVLNKYEIRSWDKRNGPKWHKYLPSIAINTSATYGLNPRITENINISEIPLEEINSGSNIATALNPIGSIKFGVLLQNHINKKLVFISNFIYEKRLFTETYRTNIYNITIAGAYNLNKQWSVFSESKNVFNTNLNNFDLRAGAVFLLNKNLQFDSSINGNIGSKSNGIGASIGFSWRLDNHVDRLIKTKHVKAKKSIKKDSFIKRAGQNTKEFLIVTGFTLADFFDNANTDISVWTKNLFLSKENRVPKRKRYKSFKKETTGQKKKVPEPKKPTKGKLLTKENTDYKSGKTAKKNRKRIAKALEKQQKATVENKKSETETKKKKAQENEANEIKKVEDSELYEKSLEDTTP